MAAFLILCCTFPSHPLGIVRIMSIDVLRLSQVFSPCINPLTMNRRRLDLIYFKKFSSTLSTLIPWGSGEISSGREKCGGRSKSFHLPMRVNKQSNQIQRADFNLRTCHSAFSQPSSSAFKSTVY